MKRRLLWVFMWAYWVFMKPTTLKTIDGGMNPVWYNWYRWRWGVSDYHARQAFSILTFKLDEPSPFNESREWKQWYRRENPERTLTRQSIHDKLLSLHMKSKVASAEREPKLKGKYGGLNREWSRWYASMTGASYIKAALVGSQKLANLGVITAVAGGRFSDVEPDLSKKHEWNSWYVRRYKVSREEADMVYMDKRMKESQK